MTDQNDPVDYALMAWYSMRLPYRHLEPLKARGVRLPPGVDPLSVACPQCKAKRGAACQWGKHTSRDAKPPCGSHGRRMTAALRAAGWTREDARRLREASQAIYREENAAREREWDRMWPDGHYANNVGVWVRWFRPDEDVRHVAEFWVRGKVFLASVDVHKSGRYHWSTIYSIHGFDLDEGFSTTLSRAKARAEKSIDLFFDDEEAP